MRLCLKSANNPGPLNEVRKNEEQPQEKYLYVKKRNLIELCWILRNLERSLKNCTEDTTVQCGVCKTRWTRKNSNKIEKILLSDLLWVWSIRITAALPKSKPVEKIIVLILKKLTADFSLSPETVNLLLAMACLNISFCLTAKRGNKQKMALQLTW